MAFRVGERVICVDDFIENPKHLAFVSAPVVKGREYTVRVTGEVNGKQGVALEEIIGESFPNSLGEWGWRASRFRPLIERKTDTGMAILRKLLDGNKIEEKV